MSDLSWIKLYRKSMDSRVFQDPVMWKLWTWVLMKANHKTKWAALKTGIGITEVKIEPGQFIFGRNSAAKELKMKPTSVRDRMYKLKNMQKVAIKSATHYSIVSVINWDIYQTDKNKTDNQPANHPPTTRQPPANHPPQTRKEKNDKNDKNKKKNIKKKTEKTFSYPVWLDLKLWQEFKNHRVKVKKPMTPYSEKLAIGKLEKIMDSGGFKQGEVINNVIEKGWQGLYPPSKDGNKKGGTNGKQSWKYDDREQDTSQFDEYEQNAEKS